MEVIKEIFSILGMIYTFYYDTLKFIFELILSKKYTSFLSAYFHLLIPIVLLSRRIWDVDFWTLFFNHYGLHFYTFLMTIFYIFVNSEKWNIGASMFVFISSLYGIMHIRSEIMTTTEGIRKYKDQYKEE
jgi:hypothetical protein